MMKRGSHKLRGATVLSLNIPGLEPISKDELLWGYCSLDPVISPREAVLAIQTT